MIIVVNSFFGVTNNRVYNDIFRTFIFSMQQSLHTTWQKNQDNSFNFRFQTWERSTIEKTTWQHGVIHREFSFPLLIFFLITTRIRNFLPDIDSAYKSFVGTAAIGLEISGCNNIVPIFVIKFVNFWQLRWSSDTDW
jgi:hypothetical protein